METNTRLEALPAARARLVFDLMQQVQSETNAALALDDDGRVLGVVGADDPQAQHLLGDLDVHA